MLEVDGGVRVRAVHHFGALPAPHAAPRLGQPLHPQRRRWPAAVRAFDGNDGRGPTTSGSSGKGGLDPSLEMAVPAEQRPVNELSALRKSVLYSWVRFGTWHTSYLACAVLLSATCSSALRCHMDNSCCMSWVAALANFHTLSMHACRPRCRCQTSCGDSASRGRPSSQ